MSRERPHNAEGTCRNLTPFQEGNRTDALHVWEDKYYCPGWGHPVHVPTLETGLVTVLSLMDEIRVLVDNLTFEGEYGIAGLEHPVDLGFLWEDECFVPQGLRGTYRIPEYFLDYWDGWQEFQPFLELEGKDGLLWLIDTQTPTAENKPR